jgi:quercetin dioxygenase-like cupin family protein/DNA-binding XRE family transcriptional regulator
MLKLSSNGNLALASNRSNSEPMAVMIPAEKRVHRSTTFTPASPAPQPHAVAELETFSHSINEQLQAYELGGKLRRLRLKKGMALSTLGKLSELSPSMICKLERGKALPTLPTLLRLSHALGVELRYFFNNSSHPNVSIVRRNERLRFRNVPNSGYLYSFESLNFRAQGRHFNVFWSEFQPTTQIPQSHQHPGMEFLYVLEGELAIRIGPQEHRLEAGDTIHFESEVLHSYRRVGTNPCRVIVVVSPAPDDTN